MAQNQLQSVRRAWRAWLASWIPTFELIRRIAVGFSKDRCFRTAAALTFTSLFALVPILVLVVLVSSAIPSLSAYHVQFEHFILSNFVARSADVIQAQIDNFIGEARHLSAMSVVSLIAEAVLMIFTMEKAFDEIWRVRNRRHGLAGLMLYWGVLTLLPMMCAVGLVVLSYIFSSPIVMAVAKSVGLGDVLLRLGPIIMACLGVFFLYRALPNCEVPVQSALFATFFTVIMFFFAKHAFMVYTHHLTLVRDLYGALAALPTFLVWLYWNWSMVLLGVEVSYHVTCFNKERRK